MKMDIRTWRSEKTGLWWLRIFAENGKQFARITKGFTDPGEPWSQLRMIAPDKPGLYSDGEAQWRWRWGLEDCCLISSQGYNNRSDAQHCLDQCDKIITAMLDSLNAQVVP